ncbi:MAG: hypothetical protein PHY95_02170 [Candidatus ainarchaeum sp.]|nr:hypothetical protein [Candidatus ainarchaeum sp.]
MKTAYASPILVLLLLVAGCTYPGQHQGSGIQPAAGAQQGAGTGAGAADSQAGGAAQQGGTGNAGIAVPAATDTQQASGAQPAYSQVNSRSFHTFTDPAEGAFTMDVPGNWRVTQGSGIIRPYIDAGVAFEAKSPQGQGFFFQDPYGYVYVTPNDLLAYAGFTEGSLYDPSGGYANPMMVRAYVPADEYARELLDAGGIDATNVRVADRPDLLPPANALVTRQSAAEMDFDYAYAGVAMKGVLLVRTTLVEISGTGIWSVAIMEYYSPVALKDDTELLVLDMQRSFKVDDAWAAREQQEMMRRSAILSQSQSDISEIISSTFEMRSRTMDELNHDWDNYVLGIEDVYDRDTGEHYIVDSGSDYYWIDGAGNIYGTDTAESPFPYENLELLDCPKC